MVRRTDSTDGGARTLEFRVPEMDCASCAGKVTKGVETLDGVDDAEAHVASARLVVYTDASVSSGMVRERVEAAGYAVEMPASRVDLSVPEMDCASCARNVERALEGVPGVEGVETHPATGRVEVTLGEPVDERTLCEAVGSAGYEASVLEERTETRLAPSAPILRSRRAIATLLGGIALAVGMAVHFLVPSANAVAFTLAPAGAVSVSDLCFLVAIALAGTPILRNGLYSARNLSLDIDFLMSAGIVGSVLTGHPFEGAMLAVLFSVAQLLERYSMDRARDSLRELLALSPETATVRRADGDEAHVPVSALEVGDLVVVRPGEKLPADGVVRSGASSVDQAPITGESVPVDVSEGSEVYAGTIAESGYLEIEVTSDSRESTVARIVRTVEEATRERTEREQFVDRFARVYTPVVVLAALTLAVVPPLAGGGDWNTWFLRGLALLVVACPCALVISTPVSVVSGLTSAARNGVLIRGGRHLETAGESRVLAIDKTGTLTTGELRVTDVVALDGTDEETVLARAAAIERRSEHPIGEAVVAAADDRGIGEEISVDGFEALTGRGVRADLDGVTHYVGKPGLFANLEGPDLSHVHATDGGQVLAGAHTTDERCSRGACLDLLSSVVPALEDEGKTVVLVGTEARPLGLLAVADQVRPEAAWTVAKLEAAGIETVMLTGDNEGTARAIASAVGIEAYHAGLLPEEKLEWIERLEREHGPVAMVGDGINDAPALASASVGIAMGAAGTDTALETADVALMGDDLTRLPYLFDLSRQAGRVIRQNIGSSLAVKAVLAAGTPFGLVTIVHAVVVGDMGMSLGVTGNAMRLSAVEPETPDD
ncbi:heavy metal translocating P-type ATPase [Natronobiforma cellulositropha]|uniref:heavy metal translocating P-type ATPase n=1 Tax=Natronobiforma cellulositropha TaxID=1679076 RepID=UPI0021D60A16|nr:heavy metal translocating P-type ATPase [Natronobiforma cellulositropha]